MICYVFYVYKMITKDMIQFRCKEEEQKKHTKKTKY